MNYCESANSKRPKSRKSGQNAQAACTSKNRSRQLSIIPRIVDAAHNKRARSRARGQAAPSANRQLAGKASRKVRRLRLRQSAIGVRVSLTIFKQLAGEIGGVDSLKEKVG